MTVFYGGRDLYDITGAITPPRRRRNWRRVVRIVADWLLVVAVFALAAAALVVTP